MHGEQLLYLRILEELASQLQSLDYPLHLRPTRWLKERHPQHRLGVFVCGAVA
jgi:hypothetical protein